MLIKILIELMATKPSLKQAYINSYIGEIPSIMNKNFETLLNALCGIVEYDENSEPYIKIPLSTTGNITASNGKFKNVVVENLNVNGVASINSDNIMYDSENSLKQKIDSVDASIKTVIKQLEIGRAGGTGSSSSNESAVLSASYNPLKSAVIKPAVTAGLNSNDANLYINALNSANSYTYGLKYYLSKSVLYDTAVFKYKADYNDVINKEIYRYYNVYDNKFVKIDNEKSCCFRGCKVGDLVIPIFSPAEGIDSDFSISLGDGSKIVISLEDYKLVTLQLICISVDEEGKCIFKIVSYNGKINLA